MSLTGSNADYRLRLRPDAQLEFVLSLIHELSVVRGSFDTDAELASALRGRSLKEFASNRGLDARVLMYLADDLISSRGRALVHAGPALPDDVHVAVNYLNDLLGARRPVRLGGRQDAAVHLDAGRVEDSGRAHEGRDGRPRSARGRQPRLSFPGDAGVCGRPEIGPDGGQPRRSRRTRPASSARMSCRSTISSKAGAITGRSRASIRSSNP